MKRFCSKAALQQPSVENADANAQIGRHKLPYGCVGEEETRFSNLSKLARGLRW
jgi:hypothetical protein